MWKSQKIVKIAKFTIILKNKGKCGIVLKKKISKNGEKIVEK